MSIPFCLSVTAEDFFGGHFSLDNPIFVLKKLSFDIRTVAMGGFLGGFRALIHDFRDTKFRLLLWLQTRPKLQESIYIGLLMHISISYMHIYRCTFY